MSALPLGGGPMRFVLVVFGFLTSFVAFAADPLPRAKPESVGMSSERLGRIGEALRADVEKGRLPGAGGAVARKGKLVYYPSVGYLDKEAGSKMTNDAIFSIASMTKPIVAVGALTLFERGQLQIEEPLGTYLPQLSKMQVAVLKANDGGPGFDTVAAQRQVTIQDLMRHTSGIIYGGGGPPPGHKLCPPASSSARTGMTGKEFFDKLGSLPLLNHPRST